MGEQLLGVDPRVQRVITNLSEIRISDVERLAAYRFSNDEGVGELTPLIKKKAKGRGVSLKVGMFVGHGAMWSLGKELPQLDLVVRLDMNTTQVELDGEWAKVIERASDAEEIKSIISGADKRLSRIEMNSHGHYHYLSSNEQLERTQDFLRRRNIAYVNGNLLDERFMGEMGEVLRSGDAEIVFSDFSNAMGWMGGSRSEEARDKVASQLTLLPFDDECVFLFGVTMGRAGRAPIRADLAIGLDEYIEKSSRVPSLGEMLRFANKR